MTINRFSTLFFYQPISEYFAKDFLNHIFFSVLSSLDFMLVFKNMLQFQYACNAPRQGNQEVSACHIKLNDETFRGTLHVVSL